MRTVARLLDWLTTAFSVIAGVAVVLLMIHVTTDVIVRSGLSQALPGTITFVSNYYMIILVCLPLAFVERKNAHISVDVLTNQFPKWLRLQLAGWMLPLAAVVFGLVAYGSWVEAMLQFRSGKFVLEQGIAIPIWVGYFAVPLGYGLGTLYALLKFAMFLFGPNDPPLPTDLDHQLESLGHD